MECRSLLKEIKLGGNTRIVLDCSAHSIRTVLQQAQQVGMMSGRAGSNIALLAIQAWFITRNSLFVMENQFPCTDVNGWSPNTVKADRTALHYILERTG